MNELRDDFELIDDVPADLIDQMQHAIATVSPWSGLIDRVWLRLSQALAAVAAELARAQTAL